MSEAARIRDFMRRGSEQAVSMVTRKLALGALSGVVMRTPVDTGRARGNWMVSIGAARGGESTAADKGGAATIANGSAVIGQQRAFQQIVIENNLPYITRLNDGHSKQAPAGYVESTLASLGLGVGRE